MLKTDIRVLLSVWAEFSSDFQQGFLSCRRFLEPHSWAEAVESVKHGPFDANYNDTRPNVSKNG